MNKPIVRARSADKLAGGKSAVTTNNVTQKSNQKTTAATPKLSVKKPVTAKTASKAPASTAKPKEIASEAEKTTALKATKKRAPKDLAMQYGEVVKAARAPVVKAAPKKRRNAASRAKLQAVIAPDDGLMQRLALAGAITSPHIAENFDGADDEAPHEPTKRRRSRKWETRCGKCGVSAQYTSSAALCINCGAILVRD